MLRKMHELYNKRFIRVLDAKGLEAVYLKNEVVLTIFGQKKKVVLAHLSAIAYNYEPCFLIIENNEKKYSV